MANNLAQAVSDLIFVKVHDDGHASGSCPGVVVWLPAMMSNLSTIPGTSATMKLACVGT